MSEIKIFRPQAGQRVEITPTAEGRLALDFVPQDATIARQGEDLVFSFPDGGTVVLVGFYDLPADHLPEFAVDGVAISGEAFFAALNNPDLMPAAGFLNAPHTGGLDALEFNDASLTLLEGLKTLGGLNFSSNRFGETGGGQRGFSDGGSAIPGTPSPTPKGGPGAVPPLRRPTTAYAWRCWSSRAALVTTALVTAALGPWCRPWKCARPVWSAAVMRKRLPLSAACAWPRPTAWAALLSTMLRSGPEAGWWRILWACPAARSPWDLIRAAAS